MGKKIILLILLFLVTGCTANYNIEIYNNTIKEDMKYFDSISSNWDSEIQFGLTYRELVTESVNYPYPILNNTVVDENDSVKLEGIEYYQNTLISDSNQLGQRLSYDKFTFRNFQDSSIVKQCYQYFNIIEEGENIILSTSSNNMCFELYPNLDTITVNLKTNHKVVSSNASNHKGYHHTWNLRRETKDDSAITITLKKNEYVFNYENEFVKKVIYFVAIVGIILGISGFIYYFFKMKQKNSNQI